MVDLGELSISVESEGVDEAAEKVQGATEGEGGGGLLSGVSGPGGGGGAATGGALGGLMGAITGLSTGMMAAVGALALIAGLLLSLKPIQKMIEATFKVIQAFLMPLAVMLMRLFMPVLGFLLRLLPAWYSFLSDPAGMIQDAIQWLEGVLKDVAQMIIDDINPFNNRDPIQFDSTSPTTGSTGSGMGIKAGLEGTGTYGANAGEDAGYPDINFFGGIGTLLERWEVDEVWPTGGSW